MASPMEDHLFARLQHKTDAAALQRQQDALSSRQSAQDRRSQDRLAELVQDNASLPVTIRSVRVLHAHRTRRGFLERAVGPVLSASGPDGCTLEDALAAVGAAADRLDRFGIFKAPVAVFLDRPDPATADSSPTDVDVYLAAHERGRYTVKTGTEAGASEADAYVHAELRNLFGGAETLNAHGSLGTRTRSAYSLAFDTPVASRPDLRWQLHGFASSALKPWAAHELRQRGATTRLLWRSAAGHEHALTYAGVWRQLTALAPHASPTVRADAGDSFKSSLTHSWTNDRRDNPLLPSRGYLLKTVAELAGLGALAGDVSFLKTEAESHLALPVGATGITLTAGLRAGLLYPLARNASTINDRFQLGGPNSVRGFRLGGLGPHDGADAVGGDLFAAGGASLLLPVPRVGKDTPLRLQAFINGGRLLALKPAKSEDGTLAADARESLKQAFRDLKEELPSAAAGVGLVYAHPLARFEINFSLPLVMRKEEQGRKGLSFGVGIEFL
ncbi:uncharacterized protein M421DRAFT_1513 [Didymella exigua CBS 183.55]|uniref:Bacterial surface antigen (D15) domain-containing protein n=1 Tax=Didymella exigua CBS 183.55 TaxID=1150837 RepID=A0A6A5RZI1_9PLEO|nr:uncharacterized protein M421DRAFT_1513 [Didymella exigua CBS 183.55]KAF1932939.1 hypothetical protein M421DRAFT_1513 [Didymella exigua CBS 183.55]